MLTLHLLALLNMKLEALDLRPLRYGFCSVCWVLQPNCYKYCAVNPEMSKLQSCVSCAPAPAPCPGTPSPGHFEHTHTPKESSAHTCLNKNDDAANGVHAPGTPKPQIPTRQNHAKPRPLALSPARSQKPVRRGAGTKTYDSDYYYFKAYSCKESWAA